MHRRRISRRMKRALRSYGFNPAEWLLFDEGEIYLKVVNRRTQAVRLVDKYKGKRR